MNNSPRTIKIGAFRKRYKRLIANRWLFGLVSALYLPFPVLLFLISDVAGSTKLAAIATACLIPYLFYLYLKFFRDRYKFDVHEAGFVYYLRTQSVIAVWDEVESFTRFAKGFRLKTVKGDHISVIANGAELNELEKLFAKKLTNLLLVKIRTKIKTGEKVYFKLNHGQTMFGSKLSAYWHGNGGFAVDSKGVYDDGKSDNYDNFLKWKDVGGFRITDINLNTSPRKNPEFVFRIAAFNKYFQHSIWLIENLEILKIICGDFCPQIKALNEQTGEEEIAELERLVAMSEKKNWVFEN